MAADPESFGWSHTTATLGVGETITVTADTYLLRNPSHTVADSTVITATPNSNYTSWEITGLKAGTTTISVSASTYTDSTNGVLTVTVVEPNTTRYLNKTGLSYFWDKVKTALAGKQDVIDTSEFPIVNAAAYNYDVNSKSWYNQYSYTVPYDGVYLVIFNQRLTNGLNNYDFNLRVTLNGTMVSQTATGGSTWTNWILGSVSAIIDASAGDVINCQASGGGTGSYSTQQGRVNIARLR